MERAVFAIGRYWRGRFEIEGGRFAVGRYSTTGEDGLYP